MPLSAEEKRERKNQSNKKYRDANKEKCREYKKKWKVANKEKVKEQKKIIDERYYQKNKEKLKIKQKEYNETNKEKVKEYQKEYSKSDVGKKIKAFSSWKKQGIKFDNQEEVEFYYENYIKSTNCNWCGKEYKSSQDRHLDHCHDCGRPRAIICFCCNMKDLVPCVLCLNS